MYKNDFGFEVIVNGRPLYEYTHLGDTFVEGLQGVEYTLRIRNFTDRRVAAVVSVDGLSVMSGKRASRDDGAYIIEARNYVDIPGWRLDNSAVAHFGFSSMPQSYAALMDKPENVGVIGLAVFFERQRPRPVVFRGDPTAKGGMETFSTRGGPTQEIGTEFGRKTSHRVTEVKFEREPDMAAQLEIRYDSASGLRARGIRLLGDESDRPNAFPADSGATPPPGWRG